MSIRHLIILGSSSQQPTRARSQGAYLFCWNEEGLLFDPGEGTQRQFIFANVSPPIVTRIFVSHFHGDHCLGLGSMLMRLNLDKVSHEVHCYFPASGQKYFDRLRYGTIYHETIKVVEHPVKRAGLVHDDGKFKIEAAFLEHGVDTIAWRVTEPDQIKFDQQKLLAAGIKGPLVRTLLEKGYLTHDGVTVKLEDVSWIRKGDSIAVVSDTLPCKSAVEISRGAKILLCESTYMQEHEQLAAKHSHLTAKQAAQIAKEAGVEKLVLTHFSARYLKSKPFALEAAEIFPNVEAAEDLKIIPFPKANHPHFC